MVMFQVYRLSKSPVATNSHGVCRDERWKFVEDQKFSTQEAAEAYVIQNNLRMNSYDLSIQDVTDVNIIRSRCLTDPKFVTKRDYHLVKLTPEFLQNFKDQLSKEYILRD